MDAFFFVIKKSLSLYWWDTWNNLSSFFFYSFISKIVNISFERNILQPDNKVSNLVLTCDESKLASQIDTRRQWLHVLNKYLKRKVLSYKFEIDNLHRIWLDHDDYLLKHCIDKIRKSFDWSFKNLKKKKKKIFFSNESFIKHVVE